MGRFKRRLHVSGVVGNIRFGWEFDLAAARPRGLGPELSRVDQPQLDVRFSCRSSQGTGTATLRGNVPISVL